MVTKFTGKKIDMAVMDEMISLPKWRAASQKSRRYGASSADNLRGSFHRLEESTNVKKLTEFQAQLETLLSSKVSSLITSSDISGNPCLEVSANASSSDTLTVDKVNLSMATLELDRLRRENEALKTDGERALTASRNQLDRQFQTIKDMRAENEELKAKVEDYEFLQAKVKDLEALIYAEAGGW